MPSFIAALPGGELIVADTFNHRILRVSAVGDVLQVIGSFGSAPGMLLNPHGAATDSAGEFVWIADTNNHRVQRLRLRDGAPLAVGPEEPRFATASGAGGWGTSTRTQSESPHCETRSTERCAVERVSPRAPSSKTPSR
jgi:hypothetical protein